MLQISEIVKYSSRALNGAARCKSVFSENLYNILPLILDNKRRKATYRAGYRKKYMCIVFVVLENTATAV